MKTIYLYRSQKGNIYSAETKGALVALGFPEAAIEEVDVKLVPEMEQVPWEPKGGQYWIEHNMRVYQAETAEDSRLSGSEYPTREQAEAVAKWDRFYRRLLALACELNPSGVPVANFEVYHSSRGQSWEDTDEGGCTTPTCVFETEASAKEACRIMNRDGWRLPV